MVCSVLGTNGPNTLYILYWGGWTWTEASLTKTHTETEERKRDSSLSSRERGLTPVSVSADFLAGTPFHIYPLLAFSVVSLFVPTIWLVANNFLQKEMGHNFCLLGDTVMDQRFSS